jgi:hypothetical protein
MFYRPSTDLGPSARCDAAICSAWQSRNDILIAYFEVRRREFTSRLPTEILVRFAGPTGARGALLLYFRESDPGQAMEAIFRERGLAWQTYVVVALGQSPWMKERGLAGFEGLLEMVRHHAAFTDQLVDSWRFPMLALAARPESYEGRTNALVEWMRACG